MQTKLTLRLDGALIDRAKAWARARGVSLSEAVAQFFGQLSDGEGPALSAWTRRVAGAAAGRRRAPGDDEVRSAHRAHLERKHR
ncbi:MAG: hypothetical protein EXR72_18890 [Myxococcales bacterium]|nr:hypothetical protein [Myxococcales bacterium]